MSKPQPTISEEKSENFPNKLEMKNPSNTSRIFAGNRKNYGQITLNTKPHSDPLLRQFRLFQKISEDCEDSQRLPKISKNNRRFPREIRNFIKRKKQTNKLKNEKPSKHLTVFSSATVIIIKLDNLTVNSKN